MTDDYDPGIQNLFDIARQDARDEVFVAEVMAQVNAQRRRTLIAWGVLGVVLLAFAAMLTGPLTQAVGLLTQLMPQPLVGADVGNALVTQVLAPLNSVAAIVGVGVLALLYAVRKIFGRC
jgi:hypothetical protein